MLIKPTMACNASCGYCSPGCGTKHASPAMSRATLRRCLEALRDDCLARGKELLTLIWHGGEPTLMPPAFYEEARQLEHDLIEREGIAVVNALQTNLTTGVERIRRIAGVLGVRQLGTSYDPDGLRSLPGADFRRTWIAAYLELRRSHSVGIIYVLNRLTRGREAAIMAHLANLGVHAVKLNWMYQSTHHRDADPHVLTATEVGETLLRMLELAPRFPLQLQGLPELDGDCLNCTFEGTRHCSDSFLGLSASGGVYNCGRLMDLGLEYGNLAEGSLAELFARSSLRRQLQERDDRLRAGACAGCGRWEQCRGGCAADAFLGEGTVTARTGLCVAFLRVYEVMRDGRAAVA